MSFDSGVKRYITGVATVVTRFPVDYRGHEDVCCDQCRFYSGRRCALTGEISYYPKQYRGEDCPLTLEEEST